MINLGRYSGKDMPDVHIARTVADWILEGISVALVILTWVVVVLYYREFAALSSKFWITPVLITLMTTFFLWSHRASIRHFNFPVKLTQQNYVYQYRIATYFTRVSNILLNLLLLFALLGQLGTCWGVTADVFIKLVKLMVIVFCLFLIVYYIIASRYR